MALSTMPCNLSPWCILCLCTFAFISYALLTPCRKNQRPTRIADGKRRVFLYRTDLPSWMPAILGALSREVPELVEQCEQNRKKGAPPSNYRGPHYFSTWGCDRQNKTVSAICLKGECIQCSSPKEPKVAAYHIKNFEEFQRFLQRSKAMRRLS